MSYFAYLRQKICEKEILYFRFMEMRRTLIEVNAKHERLRHAFKIIHANVKRNEFGINDRTMCLTGLHDCLFVRHFVLSTSSSSAKQQKHLSIHLHT